MSADDHTSAVLAEVVTRHAWEYALGLLPAQRGLTADEGEAYETVLRAMFVESVPRLRWPDADQVGAE